MLADLDGNMVMADSQYLDIYSLYLAPQIVWPTRILNIHIHKKAFGQPKLLFLCIVQQIYSHYYIIFIIHKIHNFIQGNVQNIYVQCSMFTRITNPFCVGDNICLATTATTETKKNKNKNKNKNNNDNNNNNNF